MFLACRLRSRSLVSLTFGPATAAWFMSTMTATPLGRCWSTTMAPRCQDSCPRSGRTLPRQKGCDWSASTAQVTAESDRHPGRRIADVVADTEAVADALDAERFLVFGESGGGPYALGCATLLPARVIAAVSMSGPAPFDADGLDFMAGMGQDNIDEVNAALAGEHSLRTYLSEQREALLATNPQTMHQVMESLLSPVDKAVLTGDLVDWLHAASIRGLEPGYDGWLDDDAATVRPWGFDLSDNRVPVLIQAGKQDRFVPTPTHTGSSTTFLRQRMLCRLTTATSPFSQTSSAPCAGFAAIAE